jgi:hypothetical protein
MSKNYRIICRTLIFTAVVLVFSCISSAVLQDGSGVVRKIMPASGYQNDIITVILKAQINGNYSHYEIEEYLPSGWTVESDGGGATPEPNKLQWVIIDDINGAKGATFTYRLKPSNAGSFSFSGIYYISGMPSEEAVEGETSITVQSNQAGKVENKLSENNFFSPILSWLGRGVQMECSGISGAVFEMLFTVLGLMLIGFIFILFELRKLTKLLGEEKQDIQRFELDLDKLEKGDAKKPSTELIDYIRNAIEKGLPEEQVEASLIQAGWGRKQIMDIFASLKK